jgi:hypothetical protein
LEAYFLRLNFSFQNSFRLFLQTRPINTKKLSLPWSGTGGTHTPAPPPHQRRLPPRRRRSGRWRSKRSQGRRRRGTTTLFFPSSPPLCALVGGSHGSGIRGSGVRIRLCPRRIRAWSHRICVLGCWSCSFRASVCPGAARRRRPSSWRWRGWSFGDLLLALPALGGDVLGAWHFPVATAFTVRGALALQAAVVRVCRQQCRCPACCGALRPAAMVPHDGTGVTQRRLLGGGWRHTTAASRRWLGLRCCCVGGVMVTQRATTSLDTRKTGATLPCHDM